MEDDFQWLGVGREDDQVGQTSVECLGSLVSAFLQLYHLDTIRECKYMMLCVEVLFLSSRAINSIIRKSTIVKGYWKREEFEVMGVSVLFSGGWPG